MIDNKINKQTLHNIIIENRERTNISGIVKVDNFDENEIILVSEMGEITIKGENLHISKMDVETGDIKIDGKIIGFIYNESQPSNSFIKRLFR